MSGSLAAEGMRAELAAVTDLAHHDGWARLVRGSPPQLSPRWLGVYQEAFGRPLRCVLVHGRDDAPLAGCVFHIRHPGDHHQRYQLAAPLATADIPGDLRRALEQRIEDPVAVVVAPSSDAPGIHRAEAGPHGAAAVSRLIEEVARIAVGEGARTMLMPHLSPLDGDTITNVWDGSCVINRDRTAHLDLRGVRTFDDYLARLNAERRRKILRDRRKFAEAGLTGRVRHELLDIDQMVQRQCGHYKRHGIDADPVRIRSQFESLARAYADNIRVVEVMRDADVIGHVLVVVEGEWVIPRLAGFEPDVPFAYFEAGYYRVIELALGPLGRQLIDYGGAALEVKRLRGCSLVETVDVAGVLS